MLKYLKVTKRWGSRDVLEKPMSKRCCQFKSIFKQPQNLTRRDKSITNGRRLQFYSLAVFTKTFKTGKH